MLSDVAGEFVIKPCKQSEIDFYQSAASHPEFAAYIPTFFGQLTLASNSHVAQAAEALVNAGASTPQIPAIPANTDAPIIENAWTPSNGRRIETDLAIVLENVTANFHKPNVLDVKLGARLWADDAPAEKRAKFEKVAEATTSKPLGFRIAGMRVYRGSQEDLDKSEDDKSYKLYDKEYGRLLDVDTVRQGFEEYFLLARDKSTPRPIKKIINRLVADLNGLARTLMEEESRMYSASLLFVYEGDAHALEAAFVKEKDVLNEMQGKDSSIEADTSHDSGNVDGIDNGDRSSALTNCEYEKDGVENDEAEVEQEDVRFPAIQAVKLIDFAHAKWTPGQGPDRNLLHGLENVIKILKDLVG